MFFCKFPSGATWFANDETFQIFGTVKVDDYESIEGLDAKMDSISDAVFSDEDYCLRDFAFQYLGAELVSFIGNYDSILNVVATDSEEVGVEIFEANSIKELADKTDLEKFLRRYCITESELNHIFSSQEDQSGNECIVQVFGSNRKIHTPAYPMDCDYIRVTVEGLEVSYWVSDEIKEEPASVMGAIIGAISGARF